MAVLDCDRQQRVLACNDAAWQRGIRPGHALNVAMALCAQARLLPRDIPQEMRLLESMARWAQRYTPCVSLEPPNELLLEVRGSLRLFGGAQRLMDRIACDLRELQIEARAILAPTARSALWLSRANTEHRLVSPRMLAANLAKVPVRCLQWPEDIELRLRRFGVVTLGELSRLPRADLGRRIGAPCMRELNCAFGRRAEIRTLFNPPECYIERAIPDFEIETTALLETLLFRQLKTLRTYLRQRNLAMGSLAVDLLHRDRTVTPLRIGFAMPTADKRHAARLLREKLLQLVLPAPVLEVGLCVRQLLAARELSGDLFHASGQGAENLSGEERWLRLLEQLAARLGDKAIRAIQAHDDYRPEKAHQDEAPALEGSSMPSLPETIPPRPLWLLHEPCALGSRKPADLQLMQGPERIETGWWDRDRIARDYYIAKKDNGALCWVFRDCTAPSNWYLHGLFG